MLTWLKRHYSQIAQKNWYSCEINDESMLKPCSKEVKYQLKEEKKAKLDKAIHELGLIEGKDQNGKIVLKNNIPVRKEISLKQTNKLIKKLNTNKPSSFAVSSMQGQTIQQGTKTKGKEKENLKITQNKIKTQSKKKNLAFQQS